MKKNYVVLVLLMFFSGITFAQELQKNFINYQGVARTAENQLMANETMFVGIDLKIGGSAQAPTYSENHSITTDANGVFSLKIGNGDVLSGDYYNFPWGDLATFVTVSINGNEVGTTEMTAVPYALSSGDGAQQADEVPYDNAVSGLSANNTQDAIDELVGSGAVDADSDATNEFQNLNFNAVTNELSLTDGNTVTIPSGGTDGDADSTNEIQTISFNATNNELSLTDGGSVTIPSGGTDADADPTNEIQNLSFDVATNELSLTDGNSVTIPSGGTDADADPRNEIQTISFDVGTNELSLTDGGAVTIPNGGTDADADPANELQTLAYDAGTNELSLSDGNSVTITIGGIAGTDDQNAAEVPFDNTASGLTAANTQTAIDELATSRVVDITTQNGILLGDGTAITGLTGTADGQVPKWNANTNSWAVGTDATGTGGTTASGLEVVNDGSGRAWRLVGRNADFYGPIGIGAVDFSLGFSASTDRGATGIGSVATGYETTASGTYSIAIGARTKASADNATSLGRDTEASGSSSTSMGAETKALGPISTAMGWLSSASGSYSTAMGRGVKAEALASVAIGSFNIGGGDAGAWNFTEPLFEIGNGRSDAPSNAITVLKNGNTGIGTHTPTTKLDIEGDIRSSELSGVGQRNVMADADGKLIIGSGGGSTASGLETLEEGLGFGWRLIGRNPSNFGSIGFNAVDFSASNSESPERGATGDYATALGQETIASGPRSIAMGFGAKAIGSVSTAMGEETEASGEFAVAMGDRTLASEQSSTAFGAGTKATNTHATAMGEGTTASGKSTTAMGIETKAESLGSLAIGRNNIGGGDPFVWQPNDPLFEVGNGNATAGNALTVLKNGNTGIGAHTPQTKLDIAGGQWDLNNTEGDFRIGNDTRGLRIGVATGIGPGGGDVRLRAQGGTDRLMLGSGNEDVMTVTPGNVGIGTITPTAKLDVVGDIKTSGEINRPATGTINMLAIAYGTINADGSIANGSGNFTVTTDGFSPGLFVVNINSESYSESAFTTVTSAYNAPGFVGHGTGSNSTLIIQTRGTNGLERQQGFSFVSYKN